MKSHSLQVLLQSSANCTVSLEKTKSSQNKSKQKSTKMLFHRANKTIRKMTVSSTTVRKITCLKERIEKSGSKNDNNSKKLTKMFGRAIINSMFWLKIFSVGCQSKKHTRSQCTRSVKLLWGSCPQSHRWKTGSLSRFIHLSSSHAKTASMWTHAQGSARIVCNRWNA